MKNNSTDAIYVPLSNDVLAWDLVESRESKWIDREGKRGRERKKERDEGSYSVPRIFLCDMLCVHSRDIYTIRRRMFRRCCCCLCVCVMHRQRSPKRNVVVIVAVESNHMKDFLHAQIFFIFLHSLIAESSLHFVQHEREETRTNEWRMLMCRDIFLIVVCCFSFWTWWCWFRSPHVFIWMP